MILYILFNELYNLVLMRKISLLIILFFLLTSCQSGHTIILADWTYKDLKSIEPVNASDPSADIIATYARMDSKFVNIRIDFLDQNYSFPEYNILIGFNTKEGGEKRLPVNQDSVFEWDYLLTISNNAQIRFIDSKGNPVSNGAVSVYRNPIYDSLEISINKNLFNKTYFKIIKKTSFEFQVITTVSNSTQIIDSTKSIAFKAKPPPPAQVLFAFWDTFPAYTPALTLRRWDGAHTGPKGSRHGLYNLLRTAQSTQVPLVLLDLINPYSLSALDFAGHLNLIDEFQQQKILYLSDSLPNNDFSPIPLSEKLVNRWLQQEHTVQQEFSHFPSSPLLYSPSGQIPVGEHYKLIFTNRDSSDSIKTSFQPVGIHYLHKTRMVPLNFGDPVKASQTATSMGPSIDLKKSLIQFASDNSIKTKDRNNLFFVLGGSLPMSNWGEPQSARATFNYLNHHPWVKIISPEDISHFSIAARMKTKTFESTPLENLATTELSIDLNNALASMPENSISLAAWQMYQSLFNPVYPYTEALSSLRENYIGQVWELIAASDWASNPKSINDCSKDIDFDNNSECILASENVFLIIEPESGIITFAFVINSNKNIKDIHQIIGTSSQLITGLSDPSFWQLNKGIESDPLVIPGAFYDIDTSYISRIKQQEIILTSMDEKTEISIQLLPKGFKVKIDSKTPSSNQYTTPIVIDPWHRFSNNWGDNYKIKDHLKYAVFSIDSICNLKISSSEALKISSFQTGKDYFHNSENPNFDYPSGYTLPYPLTVISSASSQQLQISFLLTEK